MQPSKSHPWLLELNDDEYQVFSLQKIAERVKATRQLREGRLVLTEVIGPAPLWKRVLGTKNVARGYFAVEWYNEVACLIFFDENWREHRVLDRAEPVETTEEERQRISHGETKPTPLEECMTKERAFRAIAESLEATSLPAWLQYRVLG